MKAKLFILSGPSGVGKNTVLNQVLANHPGFYRPLSLTTRRRRPEETDGQDYFFTDRADFEDKIASGEMFEYVEFAGEFHGMLKEQIERPLQEGVSACTHMEVDGALKVKAAYPESTVLIFILPPDVEALKRRLHERDTESDEQIQKRLQRVDYEIDIGRNRYDYQVVNPEGHPEKAVAEIEAIIDESIT